MGALGLGIVALMGGWVLGLGCIVYMAERDYVEVEEVSNLDGIQIYDWRERV